MKLFFRPMPGLTLISGIMLIILISLGTWQYHRLQWKTVLLAEIDQAANAEPFDSLIALENAFREGRPIDYRRIEVTITPVPDAKPFHVYKSSNTGIFWNQFLLFRGSYNSIFVNIGTVPDANKHDLFSYPQDEVTIAGYVRRARKPGWLSPESTPEDNRWFGFNPMPDTHDWGGAVSANIVRAYYIDASDAAIAAEDLPVKVPEIPNNHLDYMLTWYSFALILLIIYFILHYRRGLIGRKSAT